VFFKRQSKKRTFTPGTIKLSDPHLLEQLTYLGLTEEDLGIIKGWYQSSTDHFGQVSDYFYKAIEHNTHTHDMLKQHSSVDRQKPKLMAFMKSFFGGVIDDAYVADRIKVGRIHKQIGLAMSWYVFQYEHIKRACMDSLVENQASIEEQLIFQNALWKLIQFDMSLILDALNQSQIATVETMKAESDAFIDDFGEVFKKLAKRDLSVRMNRDYQGSFRHIAEAFNHGIQDLAKAFASIVRSVDEQTTTGVQFLANATQEIAHAIGDVADNAEQAKHTTSQTVDRVSKATENMSSLSEKSTEIGKVTVSIEQIAEQINLLALNATIEASRAGESGKGFAVVASEIRALAKQTDEAIDGIREVITSMQDSSSTAMNGIKTINQEMQKINDIVTNIAAATTEVDVTSKELSDYSTELSHKGQALKADLDQFIV
jgi:methyl-accepting chemotaxis protein